jgi:coatomer subunit beta'
MITIIFFNDYRIVKLWRESLHNVKAANSLADPAEYENLFPGFAETVKCEQFLKPQRMRRYPARTYPQVPVSLFLFYVYL